MDKFFIFMQTENIRFCIMNNYNGYPETIPSDVDIAIEKDTFKSLDRLINTYAESIDLTVVQKIWSGFQQCAYLLAPRSTDSRFQLHLDFIVDYNPPGYPLLIKNEDILGGIIPYKSFSVPAPEVEAMLLLMKRIVKNDLEMTHIARLRTLISIAGLKAKKILSKTLGEDLQIVTFQIIKSGDIELFADVLPAYRSSLKALSKQNAKISFRIKHGVSTIMRMFNRLVFPVGFSVVFLGPDGSGKSTIAKLVLERVSGSFQEGRIQYSRPYLLPAMGKLKFWDQYEEPVENPNPHDHPKQNSIKSLFRFFYYFLDYVIGYPVKIYFQKVRRKIIIFDRYYYDYLVDLHRYQFNIPQWLPKLLLNLIPKPDLTIYLDAEPEILFIRKKELSQTELSRQVTCFRALLPQLGHAYLVNTEKSIELIVNDISKYIFETKAKQTKRIMRQR